MRKKVLSVGLAALLLMAVVPGVAFAAGVRPFTASAGLTQDSAGAGPATTLLSAVPAPPELIQMAGSMLGSTDVPGSYNPGQGFVGTLKSNVPSLKASDIDVTHNSWVTADLAQLAAPGDSTPLFGIAWGSFTANHDGDVLVGGYGAVIQGFAYIDPACFAVSGGLAIYVDDVGTWSNLAGTGDLADVGDGGNLGVHAEGCLYNESAVLNLTGSATMGTEGVGQSNGHAR